MTKINFHACAREQRRNQDSPPECACCGKPRTRRARGSGWRGAHGLCHTCTERWRAAGKPATGVPPRVTETERRARIVAATRDAQRGRAEDYAFLRDCGLSRADAAARVGVTERTARRVYDRMLAMDARSAA